MKSEITVLRFGGRRLPCPLGSLRCRGDRRLAVYRRILDEAIRDARRVVVIGDDADLAAVLSRLLRTDRLDIEVAYPGGRPGNWFSARRAVRGRARRVPLIRDDTGTVLVGSALWLPPEGPRCCTAKPWSTTSCFSTDTSPVCGSSRRRPCPAFGPESWVPDFGPACWAPGNAPGSPAVPRSWGPQVFVWCGTESRQA